MAGGVQIDLRELETSLSINAMLDSTSEEILKDIDKLKKQPSKRDGVSPLIQDLVSIAELNRYFKDIHEGRTPEPIDKFYAYQDTREKDSKFAGFQQGNIAVHFRWAAQSAKYECVGVVRTNVRKND
jgi:predicted RND superfamily exporter protein